MTHSVFVSQLFKLFIILSILIIITENVILAPETDRSFLNPINNSPGVDPNKVEMGYVELIPQQTQMFYQGLNALNRPKLPQDSGFPLYPDFQGGGPQQPNFQGAEGLQQNFQGTGLQPNFQQQLSSPDFQQPFQGLQLPNIQGLKISNKLAIRKLFFLALKGMALGGIALIAIPVLLIGLPLLAFPFLIYLSITMLPMLIGPFILLAIILRLRPLNVNVIQPTTTAPSTTAPSGRDFLLRANSELLKNLHPELALEMLSPVYEGKVSYCTERIFCEISKAEKTKSLTRVIHWLYRAYEISPYKGKLYDRIELAGKKSGNCEQFECNEKMKAVRKFFEWND